MMAQLGSDFDEQLFKPELYELDSENDAQEQQLLPYPTWSPLGNMDDMKLPGPLSFVQSDWFLVVSGLVVAFNIMCMYIQVACSLSEEDRKILSKVNEVCLVFYTAEVVLRLLHFRGLFCRHAVDARWNVFDLVIVAAGIFDTWLQPALNHEADSNASVWLPLLRMIRVLRFLRVVKLLGVLFRSDLRWTESVAFASVVSAVIIFSVILMGLETDIQSPLWEPTNDLILLFFLFELTVNLRKQGCVHFFTSEDYVWNVLDLFIVVVGTMDQWVIKLFVVAVYGRQHSDELGNSLMLFRLLRMLRILRVLRLVKAVHPLYMLALGIAEAVQSMFWVLLLTLVALYASAIIITRIVLETGNQGTNDWLNDVPESARHHFRSVPDSMFTLFVLMNGEEWPDVMPLLDAAPSLKFMFVLFIIISTWALLSVMTGVVSDNMIYAREAQSQKDDALQGERRAKVHKALSDVFFASHGLADDRRLTPRDWQELLKVPFYAKKIMDVVPLVPKKDLLDMFSWLEADEADGKIEFQEVLRGVQTLAEPPSGKSLLQVDSEVKQRFSRLQHQVDNIDSNIMDLGDKVAESYDTLNNLMDELYELAGASVVNQPSLTPDSVCAKNSLEDPASASLTPSELT